MSNRRLLFRSRSGPCGLLAALCLIAGFTGCRPRDGAADPASWKLFSSEAGRFSVLFPGVPKQKVIPKKTATGEFERGYVRVADMVTRQPWADDVPVQVLSE